MSPVEASAAVMLAVVSRSIDDADPGNEMA